jgi:hypothetical protein
MRCVRCGFSAPVLKTCRRRDGGEQTFAFCDSCYGPLAHVVWIVPGLLPCFGTCVRCGEWVSVRELRNAKLGGRRSAPSGTCVDCAGKEA